MKWLDRLERKMGNFYIPNLMKYLCLAMAGIYILEYLPLPRSAVQLLYFDRELILQGQIWRVFTFLVVPGFSSLLWALLRLYFYYFLGTALERTWGSRKFSLYIFIGWLSCAVCGFLVGFATNSFLYTTLLLAFAVLYPEMEFTLFFILPVKVKWIGWLTAAFLLYSLLVNPWIYRIALMFSLAPFLLFFGRDCFLRIKLWIRHIRYWLATRK